MEDETRRHRRRAGPDARIEAAVRGDEAAWASLYDELAPAVLAFLRGRGADEPEDVLGEVMLQVARDLRRFRGDEQALRGWVLRVARNRLIDDVRSRARRPAVPAPEDALTARAGVGDAEREALERIGDDELLSTIRQLKPTQRDVLILRFFSELTIAETAEAMGRRPGAVKALQRRALAALRELTEGRGESA